jgi:SET domain-containing protein
MRINTPSKIYVESSPIHGLGVFALEDINEGEILEICPVIDMGMKFGETSSVLLDYRFNWPQGTNVWEKQVVATGFSLLYNHSNNPNAGWRSNLENNTFEFYSIKNIKAGEEVFVWYGDISYWNDGRTHTNVV